MRIALIYCLVMEDEIARVLDELGEPVVRVAMPQGLHNDPPLLRHELQAAVERLEQAHDLDAIVLGYGLCSRGIENVHTRRAKLVVPRAHDCITLLLGSKERYREYVGQHPATYWYSVGWNRHHLPPGPERVARLREQYIEQYGEDNADFLMEEEQHWLQTYRRAAFVDTGVGPVEEEARKTRACADWLGWQFDRQTGSLRLLRKLLAGEWDDDEFLVLAPGQSAKMAPDERVVTVAD